MMRTHWERHFKVVWNVESLSEGTLLSTDFEWYYPGGKRRYMEVEGLHEKNSIRQEGQVKVWNISDEVLQKYYEYLRQAGLGALSEEMELESDIISWVFVYAGWGPGDPPLVYLGKVIDVPETEWDGADKVVSIRIADDLYGHLARKRCPGGDETTFPPGTLMSDVVKKLVSLLDVPLGAPIMLGYDFELKEGIAWGPNTAIIDALLEVAEDTFSVVYIQLNQLFFLPLTFGAPTGITLSKDTGLIWSSKPIHRPTPAGTVEIQFKCLIDPRIHIDSIVTIDSKEFKGDVRIEAKRLKISKSDYYYECIASEWNEEAAKAELEEEIKSGQPGRLTALREAVKLYKAYEEQKAKWAPVEEPSHWPEGYWPEYRWNEEKGIWELINPPPPPEGGEEEQGSSGGGS